MTTKTDEELVFGGHPHGARRPTRGQTAGGKRYRERGSGGANVSRLLRIAQRPKQAVLKFTSFGKHLPGVRKHALYISRKGSMLLEDEQGLKVESTEIDRTLKRWEAGFFDARKNGRQTMHMMLSVPPGSDREALTRATRTFLAQQFVGHRYLFARHDDTAAPHVHVMLTMKNDQGRKPHLSVDRVQAWRETFAECCRSEGIEVDASRAWERGRAPRSPRSPSSTQERRTGAHGAMDVMQIEHHIARRAAARGERPDWRAKRAAVEKVLAERRGAAADKPWEAARAENVRLVAADYRSAAQALLTTARDQVRPLDPAQRSQLERAAERLAAYSESLAPTPTRAQEIQARIERSRGVDVSEVGPEAE